MRGDSARRRNFSRPHKELRNTIMIRQRERRGSVQDQERFYAFFRQDKEAIQASIARLADLRAYEQMDAIEHCQANIARLNAEVQDAGPYLPPYDRKSCTEQIKRLSEDLEAARENISPRKKFAFSAAKNDSALSLTDVAARHMNMPEISLPSSTASTPPSDRISSVESTFPPFILTHRQNAFIRMASSELRAPKALLSNLERCIIDIRMKPSPGSDIKSVSATHIDKSLLLLGRIDGPVHLTGFHSSTIVVTCHQFRMHEANNCTVYVSCASTPVVEKCNNIRFAPYPPSLVSVVVPLLSFEDFC